MFVVADGVGGGAMAQMASRQLVSHLHEALDAHRLNAERVRAAMLDADRAIAQRIAQVTDSPGAATVALCAPVNAFASKWLVAWVGDCRVLRLAIQPLLPSEQEDLESHRQRGCDARWQCCVGRAGSERHPLTERQKAKKPRRVSPPGLLARTN